MASRSRFQIDSNRWLCNCPASEKCDGCSGGVSTLQRRRCGDSGVSSRFHLRLRAWWAYPASPLQVRRALIASGARCSSQFFDQEIIPSGAEPSQSRLGQAGQSILIDGKFFQPPRHRRRQNITLNATVAQGGTFSARLQERVCRRGTIQWTRRIPSP
jgi:hypothetical protein